ncbi:hypothetical protein [Anaerosporobacter sp.]|uniref:hypothetical protein n=1 Tax=Anaerosporobacter sp. TaxID=1872529 RepID=UPI00286ECCB8|nr:hypothetical protein [Anaerosporobacter sp.]
MRILRQSFRCFMIELRQRLAEYQTWTLFLILCILLYQYTQETMSFANTVGYKVAPWFLPFITSTRMLKVFVLTLYIPFVCTVPRITIIHDYIIIRSKHLPYYLGQCLYIVFTAIVYSFLVMFLPIILNLTHMEWNADWGKVIGTLSEPNLSVLNLETLHYSSSIVKHFTPLQAMFHSYCLMALSLLLIGLLVYIFNMITPKFHAGILVGTFFILFDFFLATDIVYARWLWFSPLSWSKLSIIDFKHTTRNPTFTYCYRFCIIGIILSLVILYALQLFKIKTKGGEEE